MQTELDHFNASYAKAHNFTAEYYMETIHVNGSIQRFTQVAWLGSSGIVILSMVLWLLQRWIYHTVLHDLGKAEAAALSTAEQNIFASIGLDRNVDTHSRLLVLQRQAIDEVMNTGLTWHTWAGLDGWRWGGQCAGHKLFLCAFISLCLPWFRQTVH